MLALVGEAEKPPFVVAIGGPTNVASALLMGARHHRRIIVVWLGGHPRYWHRAVEFNVEQDMHAAHVLLDSGVPLVHVPCRNVTEHLRTTQAEIDRFVCGCGAIGDYLAGIYTEHLADHFARSKVLWDLGAVAWLVNPEWGPHGGGPQPAADHSGHLEPRSASSPDPGGTRGRSRRDLC